jgi:Zn-finger nucleic acid-binding protein
MDLTCPKCQGAMRTYERSGVTVDQCTECRGIFLDRGELEKLVDAENAHHLAGPQAPAAAPWGTPAGSDRRPEPAYRESRDDDRHREYRGDRPSGYGDPRYGDPRRKKKKSFLEELFD